MNHIQGIGQCHVAVRMMVSIGDEPAGGTPEEFAASIAADSQKWSEVIKRAGIRLE